MRRARARIAELASLSEPVLVVGETGTGKLLAARALHRGGPRAGKPPVEAAVAGFGELAYSELFGHRGAAFRGATGNHDGLFKQADGSSLLLDDLSDLPWSVQPTVLRALKERKIRPLGALRDVPADTRLVTTSNGALEEEVREGRLRRDLYDHLKIHTVHLPALRDHLEDLRIYILHFLEKAAGPRGERIALSEDAIPVLQAHSWPGNVRELENLIDQAVALTEGAVIKPELVRELLATDSERMGLGAGSKGAEI